MTGNICVYCPGGPDSDFEYSTQSYTGYEPTSMRAIRARYNPYLQTKHRVDQLKQLGHSVDKVEFIVMGGTFMSLPEDYRDYFIRYLKNPISLRKVMTTYNLSHPEIYTMRFRGIAQTMFRRLSDILKSPRPNVLASRLKRGQITV